MTARYRPSRCHARPIVAGDAGADYGTAVVGNFLPFNW